MKFKINEIRKIFQFKATLSAFPTGNFLQNQMGSELFKNTGPKKKTLDIFKAKICITFL